jgi:DNA-binding response OmpR family regulator
MDDSELKRNRAAVSIAMVDRNVSVSNTLRSGFRLLGYGRIELYRDADALESALHGPGFDLIIGDADIADGALLDLVCRLRNGDIGRNPFTAVIVTSWSRGWGTVRKAVDAGVDDILANPISPGRLAERIQVIVEHRKPFVVTADYTGPDRRRDQSRVSTATGFYPPNSLAEKERGRFVDDADLKWRIDVSAREVIHEKLRRAVFQLAFLQGLADLTNRRGGRTDETTGFLANLRIQAKRVSSVARVHDEPGLILMVDEINLSAGTMVGKAPTELGFLLLRGKIETVLAKVFTEQSVKVTWRQVDLAIREYELRQQARLADAG